MGKNKTATPEAERPVEAQAPLIHPSVLAAADACVLRMQVVHQQQIHQQVLEAKKKLSFKQVEIGENIISVMQEQIDTVRDELMLIAKKYPACMAHGPSEEVKA